VLYKNVQLEKGFGRKLEFRWLGPYQIMEAYPDRNYYQLAEPDGSLFKKTTHGDHLKKYHRPDIPEPVPKQDVMPVDEEREDIEPVEESERRQLMTTMRCPQAHPFREVDVQSGRLRERYDDGKASKTV